MESNILGLKVNFSELTNTNEPSINKAAQDNAANINEQRVKESAEANTQINKNVRNNAELEQEKTEQSEERQEQELLAAIDTIASFVEPQIRNVNFTQDDNSGQTVIKVFDAKSQELIKQFPSDEILELAERIKGLQDEIADKTGILIDDKV